MPDGIRSHINSLDGQVASSTPGTRIIVKDSLAGVNHDQIISAAVQRSGGVQLPREIYRGGKGKNIHRVVEVNQQDEFDVQCNAVK